ncbi:hypothetical protein JHK84_056109 [Glycine max]|nr:hypothetical protein JHK85_057086 [Glycine max]KAG5074878.1 hypothetical protein JHK84_056109 [Glycine max]
MGDHFELLVDRLLTESTLEAALESRNRSILAASSAVNDAKIDLNLMKMGVDDIKFLGKVVECRICHDDDQDSNMETPCSCCGSLKVSSFPESCRSTPTADVYNDGVMRRETPPVRYATRGNWEISRRDLNSTHLVSMVPSDQNLTTSNYDQYSASATGSLICCRSIAVIFMVLLILRHTLPLVISGNKEYSFPLFLEHLNASASSSDDESEQADLQPQPQPHVIRMGTTSLRTSSLLRDGNTEIQMCNSCCSSHKKKHCMTLVLPSPSAVATLREVLAAASYTFTFLFLLTN